MRGRWSDLLRPPYVLPALTLCLGEGIYALNTFLVSTALPSAVVELRGVELISWAFTLYLTAAIVGGASAGFLKQMLGARVSLLAAGLLFALGTLLAASATSMPQVLAGRLFQGAGEGVIAATCYALAAELFPRTLLPKMFGALAVMWASSAFGGPLIAGLLTEWLSWRAAFLVNIPLILIFLGLVAGTLPASGRTDRPAPPPFVRLGLIGLGIMAIALASRTQHVALTLLLMAAAALLLAAVLLLDRRQANRLFPQGAFGTRSTLGAAFWVVLLMPVAQAATTVYLPLFLQAGWGWRPTYAGALSALMALSWSIFAILVANLTSGRWPVRFIRLGPILVAVALLAQAFALPAGLPWLVALAQIVIGAGFGVNWGFISQAVMEAADPAETDMASGLLPTVQSAGYAIGAALAGVIAGMAGLGEQLDIATMERSAFWIFGLHGLMAVPAILLARRVVIRKLA